MEKVGFAIVDLGATALTLALPQVACLMRTKRCNFTVAKPIWFETNSKIGFFVMWWESLGPFVTLCNWLFS
jgi:hypothetical protein